VADADTYAVDTGDAEDAEDAEGVASYACFVGGTGGMSWGLYLLLRLSLLPPLLRAPVSPSILLCLRKLETQELALSLSLSLSLSASLPLSVRSGDVWTSSAQCSRTTDSNCARTKHSHAAGILHHQVFNSQMPVCV
jgi:hypothetical protein